MKFSVNKEIERKFLVSKAPDNINQYPKKEIMQGYLAITENGTEVRLRAKDKKYYQTIKKGIGKTRNEIEMEISEKQFYSLWPATEGERIKKIRYEIPYMGKLIELDVYQGNLQGLIVAEIEFNSEAESTAIKLPEWFNKEVTEDKRYKNQHLAIFGCPVL